MKRHTPSLAELRRQAIELHNEANRAAKVESRKPQRVIREEARLVRRELKHDAMMTKAQRNRFESVRQARLTTDRAAIALRKRVGEILKGIPDTGRMTEGGVALPSGVDIGKVLSRVRE